MMYREGLMRAMLAAGLSLALTATAFGQQANQKRPPPAAPQSSVPAAPAKQAPEPVDTNEARGGWRTACLKDVKQFCRGVSGGHDKRTCLQTNMAKVSAPCRESLDERDDLRKDARRVCRLDVATLCPDAVGGKAEIACLRLKAPQLTPACGEAMKAVAGGA